MPRGATTRTVTRPTDAGKQAPSIGSRIRSARAAAGLTQQQVAGDRYTKAYISALENGLVRPSVAALEYIAQRLGTTSSALLADERAAWSRLDADLQLASGNFQGAADSYQALIDNQPKTADARTRADLLRNQAEALARLDRGAEAAASASAAVEIFDKLGREEDVALASYWLSAAMFAQDNTTESRAILHSILGKVRAGLRVQPDFKLRLLMALSTVESRDGSYQSALSYLEEVRALAEDLDDRRRAAYLFALAYGYCETGDYEAAIRTGYASLALFQAADTSLEVAKVENEMSLAHLHTGNVVRADELAADAERRFSELGNDWQRAHVLDTRAQVALARGDADEAIRLVGEAIEVATGVNNDQATADSELTGAKAHALLAGHGRKGADKAARSAFERAADVCRHISRPQQLRRVLTEWADFEAERGDHKRAFDLTREALATQR